ncbi:thermostable hemolysin [Zhongshania sp. BJYM1]|uniref:thermostable hemolysin n=1 Tax=Zhongshania aquatica TaxID=2965069 RepID=UPI0022B5B387|nr:thermostable hemolysin [Marortus sp. BJYM1]
MYSTQVDAVTSGLNSAVNANPRTSEALEMSPQLSVIGRGAPERAEIEAYIANKFSAAYGAKLREFLPFFLLMRSHSKIAGVLGMRRGIHGHALFVEQYMDQPAEVLLANLLGNDVQRGSLVEIGNLVSTWRGSSQMLFIALASLICRSGAEWAVFTATPEVQKLLRRLHVEQYTLCEADGRRLGVQLADWGTYYDTKPTVIAVNARSAIDIFAKQPMTAMLLSGCDTQLTNVDDHGLRALYE